MDLCHIIKEKEYDNQLLVISKTYFRFDELDTAIDWAMARFMRDPDIFFYIVDNYYIFKTESIANFPKLRILFRFIENPNPTIYLISVEEIKS